VLRSCGSSIESYPPHPPREDGGAWACAAFAGVGKAALVGVGQARAPASARSKAGDRR